MAYPERVVSSDYVVCFMLACTFRSSLFSRGLDRCYLFYILCCFLDLHPQYVVLFSRNDLFI